MQHSSVLLLQLNALEKQLTVRAVEKMLFLCWMKKKISVFLTGRLWSVWNGLMGFILQEMSSILMLTHFFLNEMHWSLVLTLMPLFSRWPLYPFFFVSHSLCCSPLPYCSLSVFFSYRRTSETLSQAGLKATAAFSNMGSAISRKLEDVRWGMREEMWTTSLVALRANCILGNLSNCSVPVNQSTCC